MAQGRTFNRMSSPRIRRLKLDHERLQKRFRKSNLVRITNQTGMPPEQYQITYRLRGLYSTPDGTILERHEHIAEINLSLGYPRRAPQCKMLTPIFHPNFDGSTICIGDFWAASEGLDDLVIRIGRMIAYQEYNVKSPLNGLAARWAAENAQRLPVDRAEVAPPLLEAPDESSKKVVVKLESDAQRSVPRLIGSLNFGSVRHVLTEDLTTIGRGEDNTICIRDISLAEYHAQIFRIEEGFVLHPLSNATGTWIGDLRVESDAFIAGGDTIRFGDVIAYFGTQAG